MREEWEKACREFKPDFDIPLSSTDIYFREAWMIQQKKIDELQSKLKIACEALESLNNFECIHCGSGLFNEAKLALKEIFGEET